MKKMMMLTTTAYMSERFNRSNIEILESMGYEVHVVANFDKGNPTTKEVLGGFKEWVKIHHGKCISISVTNNPFDIATLIKAYKELIGLIKEHKYEFIHCHTPVAGVLGRVVAHKTHTKVMYTAHGFHFFKGAPLLNWLLYYPAEWLCSWWTDVLITINQEDYKRAKKSFHAKKIEYIPGIGIDLEKFKTGQIDRDAKRASLGLGPEDKMLLSVGELNKNKNHEIVIRAIAKLESPNVHYFIAGQGTLKEELIKLSSDLIVESQIHLLGYRNDIKELLHVTDLYVFPSKREGLSVALMEAVVSKVPVICSKIRGNTDIIKNDNYLFNPEDVINVIRCIDYAFKNENLEQVNENYECIQNYSTMNVSRRMKEIYL